MFPAARPCKSIVNGSMNLDSFDPMPEQAPVIVPWQHLSSDALEGVVEMVLLADVADQNVEAFDLASELTKVIAGLRAGEWLLVFDPETDSPALRRPEDVTDLDQ
ncbi:MAG: YheU family protein, partial [Natronospirillum sp.]